MATTANYGWTTPDDTDLVKDGASAIRSLGTAIDTTVKSVSDASGLIHINTQTFSAVSSVSLDNIFNSTYKNYRIVIRETSSVTTGLRYRLRASTTPESGSVYLRQALTGETSTAAAVNSTSTAGGFYTTPSTLSDNVYSVLDIYGPFLTENTYSISTFRASLPTVGIESVIVNTSTSYDGIEIYPSTGNFTGEFSIYGYKR